jgi:dTDP-4-amino-4,6-dideoxygalactose transaminase
MYEIGEAEIEAVARVIRKGQLFRYRGGEGGEVDRFEAGMREKLGCRHFLTVTSGTAALINGLVGLGIGPGDEVILPAYTFMATPEAVLNVGAMPVVAEVDESLLLDVADVARKITPRTKVIIPVHMQGLPCDMEPLLALARSRGLVVLEDACQAVGGSYRGRRLGTWGDAGAFSFNHFKIITCGEGGGLATSDRRVYERALIHHDGGCGFRMHAKELHEPLFAGNNYRMNEILGAILNEQLARLDGILARLRERKQWLRAALTGASGFRLTPVYDEAGDCGCVLALLFENAEARRAAQARIQQAGYPVGSPIDSGHHVFCNWTPLLERRGSFHPAQDPYRRAENRECRGELTTTSCPRTLEILDRTAALPIALNKDRAWHEAFAEAVRASCPQEAHA